MSFVLISNKRAFLFSMVCLFLVNLIATEEKTDWKISVDFLAWLASEEVSAIYADVITTGNNTKSWEALSFNFDWDYGFRMGVGSCFSYTNWDTAFYWTRYHTTATNPIQYDPNASITPEFFAAFLSGDKPQSMSVRWKLDFNMFDWELGKRFCLSSCFSLRSFLGIKGGWISQEITGTYFDLTISNVLTSVSGKEEVNNNFWGIGTSGGINTNWDFYSHNCHFLDIFADFCAATMWGSWSNKDKYINTLSKTSSVNSKDSSLGALMFRCFMGIKWDIKPTSRNITFSSKLGYEMQIWFNQLRLATFQLQRLHGDLTMQGLTYSCRIDF